MNQFFPLVTLLVSRSSEMVPSYTPRTDPALVDAVDDNVTDWYSPSEEENGVRMPSISEVTYWFWNSLSNEWTQHEEVVFWYMLAIFLVVDCANIGIVLKRLVAVID